MGISSSPFVRSMPLCFRDDVQKHRNWTDSDIGETMPCPSAQTLRSALASSSGAGHTWGHLDHLLLTSERRYSLYDLEMWEGATIVHALSCATQS